MGFLSISSAKIQKKSKKNMRNKTILSIFANIMKICVFCSANQQIDPEFFTMTEELGKWAAEHGHSIMVV